MSISDDGCLIRPRSIYSETVVFRDTSYDERSRDSSPDVIPSQVTSILIIPSLDQHTSFLVLGIAQGQVSFTSLGLDQPINCRSVLQPNSPVTALAYGRLTGQASSEIIAIAADGTMTCWVPPHTHEPGHVFSQKLQANICAAYITDIDNDNAQELVVVLTDRVVRTFRWHRETSRLMPINKWEVPRQICAFAIGRSTETDRGMETWLSQMDHPYYVCIPLSGKNEVLCPGLESHTTGMAIPAKAFFVHIVGALVEDVMISIGQRERHLKTMGWPVMAASVVPTEEKSILTVADCRGNVFIYAYSDKNVKETFMRPLVRFKAVGMVDRLCAHIHRDYFLIALSTTDGRVAVYEVLLSDLKKAH